MKATKTYARYFDYKALNMTGMKDLSHPPDKCSSKGKNGLQANVIRPTSTDSFRKIEADSENFSSASVV